MTLPYWEVQFTVFSLLYPVPVCLLYTSKGENEYICLKNLIQSKIELYDFFSNIEKFSIWKRLKCFLYQYSTTNLREKVYILGGIYGILSWRQLKIILKKQ